MGFVSNLFSKPAAPPPVIMPPPPPDPSIAQKQAEEAARKRKADRMRAGRESTQLLSFFGEPINNKKPTILGA